MRAMTAVEDLYRRAYASAERLASLRHAVVDWARQAGLAPRTVRDIELAAYEALANAVEHAYLADGQTGEVELRAGMASDGTIWVEVSDDGQWRDTARDRTARGRGIPLIHGLSDSARITATDSGTTVTMTWRRLP